jgi:hypothetical protein
MINYIIITVLILHTGPSYAITQCTKYEASVVMKR